MLWSTQFEWDGVTGNVEVECVPNDDPSGYGTVGANAYGFPVCTATVDYPRRGYRAMFGWVQLVRSTDNESRGEQFEPDPFALFGDARSPYCWYGTEPTLFDAPSRLDLVVELQLSGNNAAQRGSGRESQASRADCGIQLGIRSRR